MANIICANSGVPFHCEHLPMSINARHVSHPMFHIPKKHLLSLTSSWSTQKLSHTENYLLYLSLLNSTSLIEWRVPAKYTDKTQQIIANNMESLIHIIGKIDVITHPGFVLPHFVISPDTSDLSNSYHWIQVWIQNYNDWHSNVKSHANDAVLARRESSLNKLIRTSHKKIEDYPRILASWARTAGDFPEYKIIIKGIPTTLADYWEDIIIKCAKAETAFQLDENDLKELIDHCEDNIIKDDSISDSSPSSGFLYAVTLMKYLRKGLEMHKNYLDTGDVDLATKSLTSYRILSPETSAEDANIQNMIDNAPEHEPQKKNYPDLISFLKAKSRWLQKVNWETQKMLHTASQVTQS